MAEWYGLECPAYFGSVENSLKQCLQRESCITRLLIVPVALSCVCIHVVAGVATIGESIFKGLVHLFVGVFDEQFSMRFSLILFHQVPIWSGIYIASCLFDLLVLPIGTMIRPEAFNGPFAAAREFFGLSSFATEEELTKRYRRLALQYHPDKYNGCEAQFKKLQEAYAILRGEREQPPLSNMELVLPLASALVQSYFGETPPIFDAELNVDLPKITA